MKIPLSAPMRYQRHSPRSRLLLCPSYTRCLAHQTVPILHSRDSRELARRLCNDQRTAVLETAILPIKLSAHINGASSPSRSGVQGLQIPYFSQLNYRGRYNLTTANDQQRLPFYCTVQLLNGVNLYAAIPSQDDNHCCQLLKRVSRYVLPITSIRSKTLDGWYSVPGLNGRSRNENPVT